MNTTLPARPTRRLILRAGVTGLTALAAGCATSVTPAKPRVVVVGGAGAA